MSATEESRPGAEREVAPGVPLHPKAHLFDPGGWDQHGKCICGVALPPQREWHDAGGQWQHVRCSECQMLYVDEDDYIAFYEPDEDVRCAHEESETSGRDGQPG